MTRPTLATCTISYVMIHPQPNYFDCKTVSRPPRSTAANKDLFEIDKRSLAFMDNIVNCPYISKNIYLLQTQRRYTSQLQPARRPTNRRPFAFLYTSADNTSSSASTLAHGAIFRRGRSVGHLLGRLSISVSSKETPPPDQRGGYGLFSPAWWVYSALALSFTGLPRGTIFLLRPVEKCSGSEEPDAFIHASVREIVLVPRRTRRIR